MSQAKLSFTVIYCWKNCKKLYFGKNSFIHFTQISVDLEGTNALIMFGQNLKILVIVQARGAQQEEIPQKMRIWFTFDFPYARNIPIIQMIIMTC